VEYAILPVGDVVCWTDGGDGDAYVATVALGTGDLSAHFLNIF
jgi:hypothetical protein